MRCSSLSERVWWQSCPSHHSDEDRACPSIQVYLLWVVSLATQYPCAQKPTASILFQPGHHHDELAGAKCVETCDMLPLELGSGDAALESQTLVDLKGKLNRATSSLRHEGRTLPSQQMNTQAKGGSCT